MENISDKDLRTRLADIGHPIGAITNTTRSIYQNLYLKLSGDKDDEITVKMGSPVCDTPLSRKRSPQTDDEKLSEATFSVPDDKRKKVTEPEDQENTQNVINRPNLFKHTGIPQYQVPSLRRSTIERTALSKKLAEEVVGSAKKACGGGLKAPGVRSTETSASLRVKIDLAAKLEPKVLTRGASEKKHVAGVGLGNTNKLNTTMTPSLEITPGYMRATSSTLKKDMNTTRTGGTSGKVLGPSTKMLGASTKMGPSTRMGGGAKTTDMNRSRMRKSIRLAKRRSMKRAAPTPAGRRGDYIPKVGVSAIRKAKDTTTPASSRGAASGKKKRAPWDVKGRLEDVTNMYNELKAEKAVQDDKILLTEADLEQKTGDLEMANIENERLTAALTTTTDKLAEVTKKGTEQQFKLDEALIEAAEKVSSYERIKRDRDEIEEDFVRTKSKMREAESKVDDLERDLRRANNGKEEVEERLEKSKKCGEELENKIEELKKEICSLNDTVSERDRKIADLDNTIEKERGEKGDVHNILRRKERNIETLESTIASLEQNIKELKDTVTDKTSRIDSLEGNLNTEQRNHRDINRTLQDRESQISELDQRLAVCVERLHAGETLRRKLHNTIQELKGNIRVYCRVRPFLSSEVPAGRQLEDIPHIEFSKDSSALTVSSLQAEKLGRKGEMLNHEFSFDHVFGPRHSQEDTFAEVSGLVQSALDGYNVCIFAYGQTGSGKTHTMQGPIDPSSEYRGIIPRAMEQVFKTGGDMAEQGWKYEFSASFIEIYNENLHDLIGSGKEKIDIKLVSEKPREVEVSNVRTVNVQNSFDVHELLLKANKNRTTAATKCNERSSRSHSVFRLKIDGKNVKNGEACTGNLNLVDLAGSERVAHSGSTGVRLKEAQAINTSLSELGNVMMALQEKKTHVPYRNSKLTYLLCNCLGGNSKTLMFVNVSPLDKHTPETVNSLRFASKVNRVDLGTAKKNK